jgi:uncharacterized protein YkwD
MADRHYFDHTTPDGTTVYDELDAAGIAFTGAGEAIAENTYPVDQAASVAATALLNSPGHRAIILVRTTPSSVSARPRTVAGCTSSPGSISRTNADGS